MVMEGPIPRTRESGHWAGRPGAAEHREVRERPGRTGLNRDVRDRTVDAHGRASVKRGQEPVVTDAHGRASVTRGARSDRRR